MDEPELRTPEANRRSVRPASDYYSEADRDVARLRLALSHLLQAAILGQIQEPLRWQEIPGDYLFNETNLCQYHDLESAYAKFKIEATGGQPPALKAMLARTQAREGQ